MTLSSNAIVPLHEGPGNKTIFLLNKQWGNKPPGGVLPQPWGRITQALGNTPPLCAFFLNQFYSILTGVIKVICIVTNNPYYSTYRENVDRLTPSNTGQIGGKVLKGGVLPHMSGTRWLTWLIWEQFHTLATRRLLYETYDSRHQQVNIGKI